MFSSAKNSNTIYYCVYIAKVVFVKKLYIASSKVNICLTSREIEVVLCMINGQSVKLISKSLGISDNTVKFHIKNIMRKTDKHSKYKLIDFILSSKWYLYTSEYSFSIFTEAKYDNIKNMVINDYFFRTKNILYDRNSEIELPNGIFSVETVFINLFNQKKYSKKYLFIKKNKQQKYVIVENDNGGGGTVWQINLNEIWYIVIALKNYVSFIGNHILPSKG